MGVVYEPTLGGYTPVCNDCGIHLCWDISEYEYEEAESFWDNWRCQECNDGKAMSRKEYYGEPI
jgi:hypothetical protein